MNTWTLYKCAMADCVIALSQKFRANQGVCFAALAFLLLAPPCVYAEAEKPAEPVKSADILPYLERVIGWRRAIDEVDQLASSSREAVLKDTLYQNTEAMLQKSFAFARAQASITELTADSDAATGSAPSSGESRQDRLAKASSDVEQKIAGLKSQLGQSTLTPMRREKLTDALKLAEARQGLLQTLLSTASSEGEGSSTLLDQVNILSRTVLRQPTGPSTDKTAKAESPAEAETAKVLPGNSGIFSLSDSMLSLSRKKDALENLLARTQRLTDTTNNFIASTRAGLRDAIAQGDTLTNGSDDAAGMAAYRQSVDALLDRYKQLSAVIIPLGEMNAVLQNTKQTLQEWERMADESWYRVFHQLLIRLAILALSIAIPLIGSMLAKRAILRYVADSQKRKQLDVARRISLITLLIIVIAANFMTEFGSLATFAGFLTAGLAVGLQSVLVSLVAHSLYFGSYGIHVGDRVKVADVTGEVVQLGMLRLYLRELKETENGFQPTGKIVAFPNSILFQPSAFYKFADDDKA